jgi:hypothetical protein
MFRKSFHALAAFAMAAVCGVANVAAGFVLAAVFAMQAVVSAMFLVPAAVVLYAAPGVARLSVLVWFRVASALASMRNVLGGWLLAFMGRTGMLLHVFPASVTADLAFGIVGELAFDGPCRSQPARINHGVAADIVIGRWFTLAADGSARPGNGGAANAIGGVFMFPKNQASIGTSAGGALAPTLTVPTGTIAEFCYMGAVVVAVSNAVALGNAAWFDNVTGAIGAGAPSAGQTAIPNSKFIRYANAAAGLAVLELTN